MGISDTFHCLPSLPSYAQLELCLAALDEPDERLQCAAVRALLDPGGVDRPDLVVDRFAALAPAAVALLGVRRDRLLALARARIVGGGGAERLAAFRLAAAIGGAEAVPLLEQGLADVDAEVRDVALAGLEQRLRASWTDESSEAPLRVRDEELWRALGRAVETYERHRRRAFLALLGELGVEALPLLAKLPAARHGWDPTNGVVAALAQVSPDRCAELALGMAAHEFAAVQAVGVRLLGERHDHEFAAAVAEGVAALAAEERARIPTTAWLSPLVLVPQRLRAGTAKCVLQMVVDETDDAALAQVHVEAFLQHPAPEVRIAAVRQLGALGCPAGFAAIAGVLRTDVDDVRRAAAEVVVALEPPDRAALLTPLLGAADPELRGLAKGHITHGSFDRFMKRFDGMDAHTREIAARALSKIDPGFVDQLTEEFASLDPGRRLKALKVCGLIDAGPALRDPLLDLLDDPDLRVRATAVRIVQVTGTVEGVKILIDALSDRDRRVRANAIEAFEQLDDPSFVDVLIPFLRDRDNRVRANAAKALWNLGWTEARNTLVAMSAHREPRMRISAVWAIAELRFPGARELLELRESTESIPEVRTKILEALARLGATGEEPR